MVFFDADTPGQGNRASLCPERVPAERGTTNAGERSWSGSILRGETGVEAAVQVAEAIFGCF